LVAAQAVPSRSAEIRKIVAVALSPSASPYLWLGTASGLYRFDGVQFERYELPAGERSRSDHVYSLRATSDGGLWIAFRWGGAAFLKDGRITN
jgi:ligand-binding sensor domain-containing protein